MRIRLALKLLSLAARIEGRALDQPVASIRRAFVQGLVDELRIWSRWLSIVSW